MDSVLVLAAHPDDEVLGCGGSIARWASEGAAVHILILGRGVESRTYGQASPSDAILDAQEAAAKKAADVLGASSVELLDFPDNRMDSVPLLEVVKEVEARIALYSPGTLVCHQASDVNVDHQIAHRAAITAARPQPGHPTRKLLFFETLSSTEWQVPGAGQFAPTWFVDIEAHLERKLEALACYEHEMRPWPHPRSREGVTALARTRGCTVGLTAAEAFVLGRNIT